MFLEVFYELKMTIISAVNGQPRNISCYRVKTLALVFAVTNLISDRYGVQKHG